MESEHRGELVPKQDSTLHAEGRRIESQCGRRSFFTIEVCIVTNLKITKIYVGIQNNKYMGIQIKYSNYRTHTAVWKFVLKYVLPLVFRSMTSIEVS